LQQDINFFIALEKQVWETLRNGAIEAASALLSDDFIGVDESGLSTKEDHLAQLQSGPIISDYKIKHAQLLQFGPKIVSLTYSATASFLKREVQGTQHLYFITSLWTYRDNKWINIFSQDTKGKV
jgi:hypothetical protein